jgi:hypothetical protein
VGFNEVFLYDLQVVADVFIGSHIAAKSLLAGVGFVLS